MDDTVRAAIFFKKIEKTGSAFLFGSDLLLRDIKPGANSFSTGRECLLFGHADERKAGSCLHERGSTSRPEQTLCCGRRMIRDVRTWLLGHIKRAG
jgi:hypothetical protein